MGRPFINNRGVALIVVILMISIIVTVTLELNRSSRASVYEAANLSDQVKIRYLAKSGFNCGVALLLEDKNKDIDALNEDWAVPEVVAAKTAGLFEEETVQITITDESGKIPLNMLDRNPAVRELFIRLLRQPEFGLDEQKAKQIVDAIKDWIDADDKREDGSSESSYFSGLNGSYKAKNNRLDCIDEILVISGLARELYYGTKETPGIGQYLTVYGGENAKININTAPIPVLKAFFNISTDAAIKMDAYRKTPGAELIGKNWYNNINLGAVDPVSSDLITTTSNYFEVTAIGRLNNMTGQVVGVVKRSAPADRKTITLLSWRSE